MVTGGGPNPHPGGLLSPPMAKFLGYLKSRMPTTAPGWSPVAYSPFLGCRVTNTTLSVFPWMDGERSWPRTELGAALEDPATPAGAGASMEPPPVGARTWLGEKEEQPLRGLSHHWWFHFFPLSKSQRVLCGCLQHLPAPGLTGVHPKMLGEPLPCPSQAHLHPQPGEMGLERGSQSLGDPKTSAHTAGTGPELSGQHGHCSHLPLPHTSTHTGFGRDDNGGGVGGHP